MTHAQKLREVAHNRSTLDAELGQGDKPARSFSMMVPGCHPHQGMRVGYRDGILALWCRGCGTLCCCAAVAT